MVLEQPKSSRPQSYTRAGRGRTFCIHPDLASAFSDVCPYPLPQHGLASHRMMFVDPRIMRLSFAITVLAAFTTGAQALWCCCSQLDETSKVCCGKQGQPTFYSPKCGLYNGQTCDLGGNGNFEGFKDCCAYREGIRGSCF
jgi:hypothetical protein